MEQLDQGEQLLSAAELTRLADLARISLTAEEHARLPQEMASIVRYLQLVSQCPLPESAGSQMPNPADVLPFRVDEVRSSIAREVVLQAAPERLGDGFGVPKIIE